jgi:hypothetical protein
MALETTTSTIGYEGNESTSTPYEIPFAFLDSSHLQVKVLTFDGDDVDTETVLTPLQYTVTQFADLTGRLTTASAVDDAEQLVITRQTPRTQPVRLENGNLLTAETLEAALDRLTMIVQEIRDLTEAALVPAHASTHASGASDPLTLAQAQITGLVAALATLAPKLLTTRAATGTLETLVLADAGKRLTMSSTDPNTVLVPLHASVAIEVGSQILIQQIGTGQTTIEGDTGVTINSRSDLVDIAGRWGVVALIKDDEDEWTLTGDRA